MPPFERLRIRRGAECLRASPSATIRRRIGRTIRDELRGRSQARKVLEGAGLIERRKAGRRQICTLKTAPLKEAEDWLKQWEKFWSVRLDRLQALVEGKADRS